MDSIDDILALGTHGLREDFNPHSLEAPGYKLRECSPKKEIDRTIKPKFYEYYKESSKQDINKLYKNFINNVRNKFKEKIRL